MPVATLVDVKRQLNIPIDDHHDDEELQQYLDGVVPLVERIVGPVDDREVTERHDGGGRVIALGVTPVVALVSVTTLAGVSVDVDGVDVDGPTGAAMLTAGGRWPTDLRVVYTAGRGGQAPPNVRLATLIIVQHLWSTQRGRSQRIYGEPSEETVAAPGFGFAIPRRAAELLRPDERGPTLA